MENKNLPQRPHSLVGYIRHRTGYRGYKTASHHHHPHVYKRPPSSSKSPQFPSSFSTKTNTKQISLSKTAPLLVSLSAPEIKLSTSVLRQELANSHQSALEEDGGDSGNRRVVLALYDALSARDVDTVHQIVAPDLEWWFHGPPTHQFLMRLLTGNQNESFRFEPQSVTCVGPIVLVEGCDRDCSTSWVHAWTVTHGIITQVREYFNTSLTVTRLGSGSSPASSAKSSLSSISSKSSSSTAEITSFHCPSVWDSSVSDRVGKSVPGLVLAI